MHLDYTHLTAGLLNHVQVVGDPYSGKANDVFDTSHPDVLIYQHTDRVSAGNGERRDVLIGKGQTNHLLTTELYQLYEASGIPTHLLEICPSRPNSEFVLRTTPIKLEVIGRWFATGSVTKRYGFAEDHPFTPPFVEFTYKNDASGDPPIAKETIVALGLATAREIGYMEYLTERIAYIARDYFARHNIQMVDFKVEFGRLSDGTILLIDETSADTFRLRDNVTGVSLDKDVFRKKQAHPEAAYAALRQRLFPDCPSE